MRLSLPQIFRPQRPLVWRNIHWPAALDPEHAVAALRQIGTDHYVPLIAFEVEASAGSVSHRLGVPPAGADRVEQLFGALISDAAMTPTVQRSPVAASWKIVLSTRHRPLHAADPERVTRALLAALTSTKKNERVTLQWVLGPSRAPRVVPASEPSTVLEPWWRPLLSGETELDPERRRALEAKRGEHAFACVGRVGISAGTPARTRALAVAVLAALRTSEAPGIGVKLVKEPIHRFNEVTTPWSWPYSLNILELVGLLGWPLGDKSLPGFSRDSAAGFARTRVSVRTAASSVSQPLPGSGANSDYRSTTPGSTCTSSVPPVPANQRFSRTWHSPTSQRVARSS